MMRKSEEDTHIVRSPFSYLAEEIVVPNVPYPQFLFECIRKNIKVLQDRVALVDAVKDQCIMFKDIEPLARRFASALIKRGFEKGDVFFYVTYNAALFFVLQLGVQLCGGATRGCFQKEEPGEMEKQMRETRSRYVLCEPETAEVVKAAAGRLGWPVNYFSIDGEVEGASPVEEMAYHDDGSAYNENVAINPGEDVLFIASTSGSTGHPKGVLHTHRNMVALHASAGAPMDLERFVGMHHDVNISVKVGEERVTGASNAGAELHDRLQTISTATVGVCCLAPEVIGREQRVTVNWGHRTEFTVMGNYNIGPMISVHSSLMIGCTYVSMSKFETSRYFRFFDHYKPDYLGLFPYFANVISRSPELETRDVAGVEKIKMAGSVINVSTLEMLKEKFPRAKVDVGYGMTETFTISSTWVGVHHKVRTDPVKEALCARKVLRMGDETFVSSGVLFPLVEAKITDVESGNTVGRGVKGRILVRSPHIMKGYISSSKKEGFRSLRDEHGWLDTGDLGFFDDDGHIYVIERLNMIFKYLMHQVSPVDIEGVILQHPSVQSVGVVGVPNPETTSAARAYVVIKPGCSVTEEEITKLVAESLPFYKHLHGGVVFMDKLPESRGGKVDKPALLKLAIGAMKS